MGVSIVNDPGQPGTKIAVTQQDLADTRCFLARHDHPDETACPACVDWGQAAWAAIIARYMFAERGE